MADNEISGNLGSLENGESSNGEVPINNWPFEQVTNLTAPAHVDTFTFAASWKIPYCLTNTKNARRIEVLRYQWVIFGELPNGGTYRYGLEEFTNWDPYHDAITSSTLDVTNCKMFTGEQLSSPSDFAFYPHTSRQLKIRSVQIRVRADNSKGAGYWAWAEIPIDPPNKPAITALEQDENTGQVSCEIIPDENGRTSLKALSDTVWRRTITDTRKTGSKRSSVSSGTFNAWTLSSKVLTTDIADRQQLVHPKYVCVEVEAYSRGIAGDSEKQTRRLYLGQPAKPAINTKKIVCPSYGKSGSVVVPVKLNATTTHPVTGVKLQYINNVTYTKASQLPNSGWSDCGVADDGKCTALAVEASDITSSERGKRTWIRIKTWNQTENILPSYSAPVQLTKLYKAAPTAVDDTCGIVSITPQANGTSVAVVIGYTENNTNTGTEVTWADRSNAWTSTEQPQSYSFTWKDGTKKSTKWGKTTTVIVCGLTEGVRYHFRARRYLEGDNGTTYTPWSARMSVVPSLAPSNVVMSAPSIVKSGSGCKLGWTYDGGKQTSWRILSGNKVVTSGNNNKDNASITAAQLKKYSTNQHTVSLLVEVTTKGGSAKSSPSIITLATPPKISIKIKNNKCVSQPLVVRVTSTIKTATLICVIRARGCGSGGPGLKPQIYKDVIWSGKASPKWKAQKKNGKVVNYLASVTMPEGLNFRDKARYTLSMNAVDPSTGLTSATVSSTFSIAWSRQATPPLVTITPSDTSTRKGIRTLACRITIENAPGSSTKDVYDIWRVTPDGEYLVYSGAVRNEVVLDKYAPYGREGTSLIYRVVTRTKDGDTEWSDFQYQLIAKELRIDFGNKYVELPYNLEVNDSWTKDFETRRKLDGTIDGYWNEGVERKGGLNSKIIKITDSDKAEKIRELAKYTGPCLVRLPDGCCYMANIDIEELSWKFTDVLMAVSINATEIDLTDTYKAKSEYIMIN